MLKPTIVTLAAVVSTMAIAADEAPADSHVVQLRAQSKTVLAELSPGHADAQGCRLSGSGWVAIELPTGKGLYTAMLAASTARQKVGVELSGCTADGLYPLVQRVDVLY